MKNTDTRHLKRDKDGFYRSSSTKLPCDHCGWSHDCHLRPRARCDLFLPSLPFTDETGLRKVANTIRVGKAWTERLIPNQVISLWNSVEKRIFGHARVLSLHTGPIVGMLRDHAHANHLMLDTPPDDAAKLMLEWQRRQYGPRIIHDQTQLTAIYLLRERFAPPPPYRNEAEGHG